MKGINIELEENTSCEDFASKVAEVLIEEYGPHNFDLFVNELKEKLNIGQIANPKQKAIEIYGQMLSKRKANIFVSKEIDKLNPIKYCASPEWEPSEDNQMEQYWLAVKSHIELMK